MKTIHLITPVITQGVRNLDEIAHLGRPDLRFTHALLNRGSSSIESEFDQALSVPDTILRAMEAERAGADAIIIDCMGDPGLRPSREAVKIPVLGVAESSMHMAAMLGHKFSVVTVLDSVRPMLLNLSRIYGVSDKLASVRVVDIPVLELADRLAQVQQRLAQEALLAVERDGADVVVLGCTGFLGCAAAMEQHLLAAGHDVPVIDPIPTTVCMAEAVIRAGLRHSKRTFGTPRAKAVAGYQFPA